MKNLFQQIFDIPYWSINDPTFMFATGWLCGAASILLVMALAYLVTDTYKVRKGKNAG